tara:strand:+ start:554 stop:736 length:183 start_codon:yes stop_codon:yes gene_type:complete
MSSIKKYKLEKLKDLIAAMDKINGPNCLYEFFENDFIDKYYDIQKELELEVEYRQQENES